VTGRIGPQTGPPLMADFMNQNIDGRFVIIKIYILGWSPTNGLRIAPKSRSIAVNLGTVGGT
jgi:hypothetical protein